MKTNPESGIFGIFPRCGHISQNEYNFIKSGNTDYVWSSFHFFAVVRADQTFFTFSNNTCQEDFSAFNKNK
jgi:hypothetical protein